MTKKQTLKHFINESEVKVSNTLFKEFVLEGSNRFDIERICRGMETVDLYHFDSCEVMYDVSISELIPHVKN